MSSPFSSSSPTPSLAILDDYHSLSPPYFSSSTLPSSNPLPSPHPLSSSNPLHITSYPSTLSPHNPSHLPTLISRLKPHTIISTMRERTPFPAFLLSALPNLNLLLTTGMRNASLDLDAAKERGIVVAGTSGRGVRSRRRNEDEGEEEGKAGVREGVKEERVEDENEGKEEDREMKKRLEFQPTAQHTWSLILALTSRVAVDSPALQIQLKEPLVDGNGNGSGSGCAEGYGPWESGFAVSLAGKTLGIVGLGKLGAQVARTGVLGFGMRVLAWSENLTQEKADETVQRLGLESGVFEVVSKEVLFRRADVVSLHYVLSGRSRGVVGERELGMMKRGAFLVNTSRGGLIEEEALYRCLVEGGIRGVGLDVFWSEPLGRDSKWRTTRWGREGRSEVVLSPHMGYVDESVLRRWYEEQAENVDRWLKGEEVLNRLN